MSPYMGEYFQLEVRSQLAGFFLYLWNKWIRLNINFPSALRYEAGLRLCTQYFSFASYIPVGSANRGCWKETGRLWGRRDFLFPVLFTFSVGTISHSRISVSLFDSSLLISRNSLDVSPSPSVTPAPAIHNPSLKVWITALWGPSFKPLRF